MKSPSIYALVAFSVVGAGCVIGCGSKSGSNVAIVNGEAITTDEYYSWLQRKPTIDAVVRGPLLLQQGQTQPMEVGVSTSIGLQGLYDLVTRHLILEIAKDEGVAPNEKDIEDELSLKSKEEAGFVKNRTSQGLTLQQIRTDLSYDLAKYRILTKGITVTDEEVNKFIKDEKDKYFKKPEQAELYWIVIHGDNTKRKDEIDKDLRTGTSFPAEAVRFSEDASVRRYQGHYPVTVVKSMRPALQKIVAGMRESSYTDWIKDGKDWVRFYLQKRIAESDVPIDDAMKNKVKRALAIQQGSKANDLNKRMLAKLSSAKIDVTLQYLKEPWQAVFENMKKAAAAQNQPAPGAMGSPASGISPAPNPTKP